MRFARRVRKLVRADVGRRVCAGAALTSLVLLPACGPDEPAGNTRPKATQDGRFISAPVGVVFRDVAWLDADTLVVMTDVEDRLEDIQVLRLASIDADGSNLRELPLLNIRGCPHTMMRFPERLPDGRLGYARDCLETKSPGASVTLRAYDALRAEDAQLASVRLPHFTGRFSYAPGLQRGIVAGGCAFRACLRWILPSGLAPVDTAVELPANPTWSPDGTRIAFSGVTPHAMRRARGSELRESLFVMEPTSRRLHMLVDDATDISAASWSPDARWLAVSMAPRGFEAGLWLVNARTKAKKILRPRENLGPTAWSLDGGRVAVVLDGGYSGADRGKSGIYLVTVRHQAP